MNRGENGRHAYFIGERIRRKKKDKRIKRKMLYEHLFSLEFETRKKDESFLFRNRKF